MFKHPWVLTWNTIVFADIIDLYRIRTSFVVVTNYIPSSNLLFCGYEVVMMSIMM